MLLEYVNNIVFHLQFQANYGKPLQASREGKCSSKEAEAGVLAMEALHKQVLYVIIVKGDADDMITS